MLALTFAVALADPTPVGSMPPAEAAMPDRQAAAIARCLTHWDEHPFGVDPPFRVLSPSVRVLGMGSREANEDTATPAPDLVLVEPSVNVLTRTTFGLRNPNGWYCFAETVGVLSKIVYDATCGAHLADARTGAVVMGRSATNGGVIVLGAVEIQRDCPTPAPAPPG